MIDVVVTMKSEDSDELLQMLRKESSLEADSYKSVGIEGGGNYVDVIASLSQVTLGFFIAAVTLFRSKETLKITIGETTIEITSGTKKDLEETIETVFKTEQRRVRMQSEIDTDFLKAIRNVNLPNDEMTQLERQITFIRQKDTLQTNKYDAITRIFNILGKQVDHAVREDLYDAVFRDEQGKIVRFDAFLSFAREDVETASKIYSDLTKRGLKVWFSREHLRSGQSILGVVTKVIQNSNSGIVLLSANTFSDDNHFPMQELKTLQNQNMYRKLLLFPIYHGISHDYILDNYPMLSDLFACSTQEGIEAISEKFIQELKRHMKDTK